MSQETSSSRYSVPRTRRVYSAQFKADLIAACLQPGASIAATAREHGMNANVLHRWLREHRLGLHQTNCYAAHAAACDTAVHSDDSGDQQVVNPQPVRAPAQQPAVPAFIAMALGCTAPGSHAQAVPTAAQAAPSSDIRIECCHHGTRLTVHWPLAAAAQCSSALQGLLQVLRQ